MVWRSVFDCLTRPVLLNTYSHEPLPVLTDFNAKLSTTAPSTVYHGTAVVRSAGTALPSGEATACPGLLGGAEFGRV